MKFNLEYTQDKTIIKLVANDIITKGSLEFERNSPEIKNAPVVHLLFNYPFIQEVFITANIIAIKALDIIDWKDFAEDVLNEVEIHIAKGGVILKEIQPELSVSVYAEQTPNPKVMKFVTNKILTQNIVEIKREDKYNPSPLAKVIFDEEKFVKEIFLSQNYFSISIDDTAVWDEETIPMREKITNILRSGVKVLDEDFVQKETEKNKTTRSFTENEQKINQLLEDHVKPAVAGDGGNIELVSYDEDEKTVLLMLQGACSGCPSSTITLKQGIETMMKTEIPDLVEKVEAING